MKKFLFIFFLVLAFTYTAPSIAQCTIDYSYNPIGANFGLSPDTLPDAVQGYIYDQDLTFVLPLDTTDGGLTVTFTDFHIVSINLPLGLTWQCSNYANSCHYDPAVDQYGCVNINGVPLQTGSYNVDVVLVATHSLSSLAGTETVSFSLPFEVIPDTSTSNNAGFSMISGSGCSPIQVSFINNNPGMVSYLWDFGNGNMSNVENPTPQIYNSPGTYVVSYEAHSTTNSSYFLTNIEVVSANGWDGDAEDGFGLLNPDPYIKILDQSGSVIFSSTVYVDQNFPVSYSLNNIPLLNQNYTIEVWDQDGPFTADDFCGSLSFPGFSSSSTITNGSGETVNYTISVIPPQPITASDTVNVYPHPSSANIVYDSLNNILHTDSSFFGMQWYYYNSPIPNASDTFVVPALSGLYSLVGISDYGCTSISDDILVVICDSAYQPTLQSSGMDIWMVDSALYNDVQWHSSGIPLLGANLPEFTASESGAYSITATDTFGCSYVSDQVVVCDQSQQPVLGVNGMDLWVSDSVNYVSFYWMQGGGSLANNTPAHLASYVGLYSVQTEDAFGCEYTSAEMLICDENFEPNIVVFNDVIYTSDSIGYSMQWNFNGSPIVSATNSAVLMTQSGSYSLVITDQYGCSYDSELINYNSLNSLENTALFLHPNPARQFVEVSGVLMDNIMYEIHNISGAVLHEGEVKNKMIDISVLPPGAYIVRLKISDQWQSVKLLKLNY